MKYLKTYEENKRVSSSDLVVGRMYMSDYFADGRILFFISHSFYFGDLFFMIFKNGTSEFAQLDKDIIYRDQNINLKDYIMIHNILDDIVHSFNNPHFIGSFSAKNLGQITSFIKQ